MDDIDGWVSFKEVGNRVAHDFVVAHSDGERPNPPHQKPCWKWCKDRTEQIKLSPREALDELMRGANHASREVAVATKILGGAMEDDVDTHRSRIGIDRCAVRVVDCRPDPSR